MPSDPIFAGLAAAQKTLVEKEGTGEAIDWWKVAVLDGALQRQGRTWSKRDRQAAFEQIRKGAIPGWLYKSKGKRSAYFLEILQSDSSLPSEFRATAADLKLADDARVRARIHQTIEMAVQDFRAVASRGSAGSATSPPFDPRDAHERALWTHLSGRLTDRHA